MLPGAAYAPQFLPPTSVCVCGERERERERERVGVGVGVYVCMCVRIYMSTAAVKQMPARFRTTALSY